MDTLLTPLELAKRFPISRSTIYAACRDGTLVHYRVKARKESGGKYLISLLAFEAWLETQKVEGPRATPTPALPPTRFRHLPL